MPIASIPNALLRPFRAMFQPDEILVPRTRPLSGLAPSDPCSLTSFPADSTDALVPMPIQHIPPPPTTTPPMTPPPPPRPSSIDEQVAITMLDTDRILREVEETLVESAELAADVEDLAVASRRAIAEEEKVPSPLIYWETDERPRRTSMDWGSADEVERLCREHGDWHDPIEERELLEELSSLDGPSSWFPRLQRSRRPNGNVDQLDSQGDSEGSSVLWDADSERSEAEFPGFSPIELPSTESSFDEAKHGRHPLSRQSFERARCVRGLRGRSIRRPAQRLVDDSISDETANALPPALMPPPLPSRSLRRMNRRIPERQSRISTNDRSWYRKCSLSSKLRRLRPLITDSNRPQFAEHFTASPQPLLPPSPLSSMSSDYWLGPRQLSTWEMDPMELSPPEPSLQETSTVPQQLRHPPHRGQLRPGDWSPPGLWFGSNLPGPSSSEEMTTQHPRPRHLTETLSPKSPIRRPAKRRASSHEGSRAIPILVCAGGCGKEFFQVQSATSWNCKKREIICSDCGEWTAPEYESEPEDTPTPRQSDYQQEPPHESIPSPIPVPTTNCNVL